MQIAEPEWKLQKCIARLIRMTQARAVPIYFHGVNSAAFQLAGLIHPKLRTALLPHELLNKKGHTIRVAIGGPVKAECLSRLATDREAMDYLRQRTHMLQSRPASVETPARFQIGPIRIDPPWAKIAGAVDPRALREEAANLTPEHILLEGGEYRVCVANAAEIPNTLREIGRLREIAFRKAGEGSGRSLDPGPLRQALFASAGLCIARRPRLSGAYRFGLRTDTVELGLGFVYQYAISGFRPALPGVAESRGRVGPQLLVRP